jgi:hypothetical protein
MPSPPCRSSIPASPGRLMTSSDIIRLQKRRSGSR